MTNLFKKYETDPAKENGGVPIEVDGSTFFCRRAGGNNRRYRAALAKAALSRADAIREDTSPEAFAAEDEASIEAFADSVVVGWQNVEDREGKPWAFSRANFIELMTACPDLWLTLRLAARDIEKFRVEQVEQNGTELGNS